jgi:hypothetical protein
MEEASVKRRRRRRLGILAASAAAALVVAGPLVTLAVRPADAVGPGVAVSGGKQPSVSNAPATSSAAAPPNTATPPPGGGKTYGQGQGGGGSAVTAAITVTPKEWGSQIDLELRGIVGPMKCQLLAVAKNNADTRVVGGWSVPPKGYGIPGSPDPLRLSGTTFLTSEQIGHFEVRGDDGTLLVTVQH